MLSIQTENEFVKSNLKESSDKGEWSEPPKGCGTLGILNTHTGRCVPKFCGSARCPRQKCKDIFWWKRIERLHVIGEYLHKPPDYPAKMITLTLPSDLSDFEAWDSWSKTWNKFRTVIKRKYGHFEYGIILEKHKENNRPHIHGITSLWIPQRELSGHWEAASGASVVDIRVVKNEAFADYFAKDYGLASYFGKDNMIGAFLKSRRRSICASQGVTAHEKDLRAKAPESPWMFVREHIFMDGGIDLTKGVSVVYSKAIGKYMMHFEYPVHPYRRPL